MSVHSGLRPLLGHPRFTKAQTLNRARQWTIEEFHRPPYETAFR
jgi:hypothetical protein